MMAGIMASIWMGILFSAGLALILMLGGHYSYARVPLGFWVKNAFGLVRNDYDRLGHFVFLMFYLLGGIVAQRTRGVNLAARAARSGTMRWTPSGSEMIWPTVMRGFSEE